MGLLGPAPREPHLQHAAVDAGVRIVGVDVTGQRQFEREPVVPPLAAEPEPLGDVLFGLGFDSEAAVLELDDGRLRGRARHVHHEQVRLVGFEQVCKRRVGEIFEPLAQG